VTSSQSTASSRKGAEGKVLISCLVTSNRTQGIGMKLHQGKLSLDVRERFFTKRVIGHWSRLPRKVVMVPRLSEFKEHLDDALSVIWLSVR